MRITFPLYFFLLLNFSVLGQVSIGTATPDDGSIFEIESTEGAFVPPRMTFSQMQNIPTPLEGAMVYCTDRKSLFQFINAAWGSLEKPQGLPSLTLYKNLPTADPLKGNSTFVNFPVGSVAADIRNIDTAVFEILANGRIRLKKAGAYSISAGLSLQDFTAGDHKYILAVFVNGNRRGYLARGFAGIPVANSYWGASGVFQYVFNVNDILEVQYYLDNGGPDLRGDFANIGVIKL